MYISIAQIIISVILIVLILLQERTSGLSGVFGGGDEGGFYQTRRGLERVIFGATIFFIIALIVLSLLNIYLK
ncbi:MAG: preprotein translocase subunit SecG [Patescibacteria group bacterium]|nr:preprotein translocase subunit SecG [Patescibacteria group bacterium]